MGHLFFRVFISLANQIMKDKSIAKTLGQINPINSRLNFLHLITNLGTAAL